MKRTKVLLVNLVVLLIMLAAPMLAAAAPPIPSDQIAGPELKGPAPEGFVWPKDLAGTMNAVEARAFKNSLTEAQRDAIEDVLNQYAPEFEALGKALSSVEALKARSLPAVGAEPLAPTEEEMAQVLADLQTAKVMLDQLDELQAKIDQEMAGILTPAQWARQEAALSPLKSKIAAAKAAAERTANISKSKGEIGPAINAQYCNLAAQYASVGDYYADSAYTYAYYNYIYNYYGSYNAYYYAYYANEYTYVALAEIAAAHFDTGIFGTDRNDFGYYGTYDAQDAYYYSDYASYYAYYNYYYYGYSYAYYAYSLAYSAEYYMYYAYYYAYLYCW